MGTSNPIRLGFNCKIIPSVFPRFLEAVVVPAKTGSVCLRNRVVKSEKVVDKGKGIESVALFPTLGLCPRVVLVGTRLMWVQKGRREFTFVVEWQLDVFNDFEVGIIPYKERSECGKVSRGKGCVGG